MIDTIPEVQTFTDQTPQSETMSPKDRLRIEAEWSRIDRVIQTAMDEALSRGDLVEATRFDPARHDPALGIFGPPVMDEPTWKQILIHLSSVRLLGVERGLLLIPLLSGCRAEVLIWDLAWQLGDLAPRWYRGHRHAWRGQLIEGVCQIHAHLDGDAAFRELQQPGVRRALAVAIEQVVGLAVWPRVARNDAGLGVGANPFKVAPSNYE